MLLLPHRREQTYPAGSSQLNLQLVSGAPAAAWLRADLTGTSDATGLRQYLVDILEAARQTTTHALLVNTVDHTGAWAQLLSNLQEKALPGIQEADLKYMAHVEQPNHPDHIFSGAMLVVMGKRLGLEIRNFHTIAEAEDWLQTQLHTAH